MLTSICGINWGDEGKGRMVDLLSEKFDIVCRYHGVNNAGHTGINEKGRFILNIVGDGGKPGRINVASMSNLGGSLSGHLPSSAM